MGGDTQLDKTMKIGYASDIHTEFGNQREILLEQDVDVLVLAGDIGSSDKGAQWALDSFSERARQIVYVAGNHEFWHKSAYHRTIERLRALSFEKLRFLENDKCVIDDVTFLGATCWTDFSFGGSNDRRLNMLLARDGMNDYRRIKFMEPSGLYRKLKPDDVLAINQRSSQFLFDELRKLHGQKRVVVTHHAPTPYSLDPFYLGSPLNSAYVNMYENFIAVHGPDLWIHGHVHCPKDYRIRDTRILCNPIGYPGQIPSAKIEYVEI